MQLAERGFEAYVPFAQGVHALSPEPEYVPTLQASCVDAPSNGTMEPGVAGKHVYRPSAFV